LTAAAIAEVPRTKSDVETRHAASPPTLYAPSASTVYEIPVDLIVRSETNRQPQIDDDFIESIRRGVDSPVLVRPIKATQENKATWWALNVAIGETFYKLVYGERRWAASKKAGKKTIPAIVRELTDTQALEIQVRENEQRKDYNVMDRAAAYAHLRAQYMKDHHGEKGFTEEKCCALIAEACKNDKIKGRTVQQIIALGKLTPDCQAALRKGEMEQSHAYEFSRLPVEDQAELLLWLRQQTHHSQGDIPSVRRLKLEIRNMDIAADEKRRQEKLFKDGEGDAAPPQPSVEFDGKKIDLVRGATLPISVQSKLIKVYPGLTTAHFLKDGRVQLAIGLMGKPFYLTVNELQNVLTTGIPYAIDGAPQTSAKGPICIHSRATCRECKFGDYKSLPPDPLAAKPRTKAQLKAEQERVEKEIQQNLKAQRDRVHNDRIANKYQASFFSALASKAHVCSRLLTYIVPGLLVELSDQNDFPLEAFAQDRLHWPAPKHNNTYNYGEVSDYAEKHTRKFSGNLLAALLIVNRLQAADAEQLAKYFHVDVKKLRQKALAAVKEEDAQAKLKAKGQGLKAGARA
jgi:ParB/RepB/Spo0J family partition protein